jgi:ribose transport system ATP-binding protein
MTLVDREDPAPGDDARVGDVIEVEDVAVHYGVVRALDGVTIRLSPGEVHGLVGHNGSGKSTLARLLAGTESPTSGSVRWSGDPIRRAHGVPAVHQSLGLVPELSALENYGVSSGYDAGRGGFLNWSKERTAFERHRAVLDIEVNPSTPVRDLGPAQRAGLALMRCLRTREAQGGRSGFIILDEITSYLDSSERRRLASTVRVLAASGVGVIFISHYLDEVLAMCTHVTVLKAGKVVGTFDTDGLTKSELSVQMFGAHTSLGTSAHDTQEADSAQGISLLPHIDAFVRPGEVLGVTGRSGGLQEQLPYLLAGPGAQFEDRDGLTVTLVPSDRAARGVWLEGSIAENLTLTRIGTFRSRVPGLLSRRREKRFADQWLDRTNFRVSGSQAKLNELSGGMQQKVLVGRSIVERPDLLVLHEPTQGIDISARAEIMTAITEAAEAGTAVVLVSSEHDELVSLCSRVLVVHEDGTYAVIAANSLSESALATAI